LHYVQNKSNVFFRLFWTWVVSPLQFVEYDIDFKFVVHFVEHLVLQ